MHDPPFIHGFGWHLLGSTGKEKKCLMGGWINKIPPFFEPEFFQVRGYSFLQIFVWNYIRCSFKIFNCTQLYSCCNVYWYEFKFSPNPVWLKMTEVFQRYFTQKGSIRQLNYIRYMEIILYLSETRAGQVLNNTATYDRVLFTNTYLNDHSKFFSICLRVVYRPLNKAWHGLVFIFDTG